MAEAIYDPKLIEARCQQWWEENGTNRIDLAAADNPYYVLMMFPYPSAEGLHVGNVFAFTGADIQARYRRLKGHQVFEPIGFDAFGIHSENFAMKVNRHPSELIPSNVANFTRQLKMMGFMFDWERTIDTTTPEYYKWTQWVFLQLYKAGLVYRDIKEVNFCPKCGTVISDEMVIDGKCERHPDTEVERRRMPCWFFAITKFAGRLLDNLDWLDWSDRTKLAQRNWIGRSTGAEVVFTVQGRSQKIPVFTTRPDTLFGATYLVLAPDHALVDEITLPQLRAAVDEYRGAIAARAEAEAVKGAAQEKTGVFTGATAINPATGQAVPVFIGDYVLSGYGTGAIMAVPGGDHRDFAFAKKYRLPIVATVDPDMGAAAAEDFSGVDNVNELLATEEGKARLRTMVLEGAACYSGPGAVINSSAGKLSINGLGIEEAKERVCALLEGMDLGRRQETYRLRDWGISRQRYWGPPLPIIYDEEGNPHPVPEDQLPVLLPPLDDYRPKGDGRGPLATAEDWVRTTLPDGRPGRRETDVMDNFLDSAWYYLRYVSTSDPDRPYDPALIERWLPVDMYIGGNEHAVLHLLYTRFICMGLHQAGALRMGERPEMRDLAEPFRHFRAHGLLIKEGSKMSKSKGNVVNPDEYVEDHGADTLRMYLMFLGPYLQGGDFRDSDLQGVRRFLNRIFLWYFDNPQPEVPEAELPKPVRVKLHQTIKKVAEDIEALSYNTAIAALMELHNELKSAEACSRSAKEAVALMLAPFAPHLAEECWRNGLGHSTSVFEGRYPAFDPALTVLDEIEVAVQVNGKIRSRLVVPREAPKEELERLALADASVQAVLKGAAPKRVVVVPGRLVNVIA
ncbi:MAG: leucine--tRNA ligase [Candidatus Sumerlaeia bacterium]|nr:leucine--tRNA ligase [Candidatus Sumerlaeia bacterium]